MPAVVMRRGLSCTMRVVTGSLRAPTVSTVHALADGRYREERASCVVVFDGTTLWMNPKSYGPVLRSGPQPSLIADMLNPSRLLDEAYDELVVDPDRGIAVFWKDSRSGREVTVSDVAYDDCPDESLFHFAPEAHQTVVDVRFL